MWTAVSGAKAREQSVEVVANNLANSETTGFKKDQPAFKEYLANVEHPKDAMDIPKGPIRDIDLTPLDGKNQAFVVTDGTYTNFKQGSLRVTQAPLDVAMDGPGFLEVSTPAGIRFTRAGSMKIGADGRLVTREGYPVLSAQPGGLAANGGARAIDPASDQNPANRAPSGEEAARFINLRDRVGAISIDEKGEIYSGQDLIAKLSVVEFQDPNQLRKSGSSLFVNKNPANAQEPVKTLIRQGVIEGSNVNPVEEMANLIKANRLFEHDLKALKTYGELMGREANDIGKL